MSDAEETLEFECGNCLLETTEFDDCPVCGAAPYKGEGYRIECLDCGSIAFGDPGADVQHDMWHHREHYCPGAEFEVRALE